LPRAPEIAKARVVAEQPRLARARSSEEIHIAVASLVRGGAERIVLDTCRALARSGRRVHLIVLHRRADEYPVPAGVRLSRIGRPPERSIDAVACEIARSGARLVLAHLLRAPTLERFWRRGVATIPVIHNMSERWIEDPSSYRHALVPCVIAVSAAVARDLKARCAGIGVTVVRHDLAGRNVHAEDGARALLRGKMDLKRRTLLIGMVGNFKLHKGYPRALRVLAEVLRVRDARLLIAGAAVDHEGRIALQATRDLATRLALERRVLFTGSVARIEPLLAAFDVYLSTSLFEGLSVAALEARAAGLPLVLSSGGGQEELAGPNVTLLPAPFEPRAFAAAVVTAGQAGREPPVIRAVSHRLWALHGRAVFAHEKYSERIAFVTANLNAGGAQRSLVHLLRAMRGDFQVGLCVTQQSTSRYFLDRLRRAGVPAFRPCSSSNAFDVAEALLDSFAGRLPRIVCFWNADPRLKLLLAKALAHARVRIVDVSPGPSMYVELDAVQEFQHSIAFGAEEYFARLDALVVKYAAGLGQARSRAPATRVALIPNGVPVLRASRTGHAPNVIAAGRLAPTKHLELLPDVIRRIRAARPHCELDIAGQAEPRHHDWLDRIWTKIRSETGVRLVGALPDFPSRVSGYVALLLASEQQGCPNTSLEALAAGVPVIANADGGTSEQVIDGETGFLLPRIDPKLYAACAVRILEDPALRARLGANGREHVTQNFSIARMRERYRDLFHELFERGVASQTSMQTYVPNANVPTATAAITL
jgi:glycosyltransferase involved in cell wall biosynthesis